MTNQPVTDHPAHVVNWRHRAWLVAGVTFVVLVTASACRSSLGVFLAPVSDDFGWSTATVSFAVTVNLIVYGLTVPFAAAIMERFGLGRVIAGALALISLGLILTAVMTAPWQLVALWGLFLGFGAGCTALVFGAIIAQRWFVTRRGLVTGLFSAAFATGQLIFLPNLARLTQDHGWRTAALTLAVVAIAIIPLALLYLRETPSDVGGRPYGAADDWSEPARDSHGDLGVARLALMRLREAARTRVFWILAGSFFVCGWSTNGLIGTHFIAAGHDHGLPSTTAASLLAVVGIFDLVGTIGSGWLTDRYDSRYLLGIYYVLRGVSLLLLHLVWASTVQPPMFLFVVLYGLDWVATVPPTVALCRECFGPQRAGVIFGWVFAAHMIGAGMSSWVAGIIRVNTGSYDLAWWSAGLLCLLAAIACLVIPRGEVPTTPDHMGLLRSPTPS
ncbi:MAG: MFS transporter [Actinomycetes bacterium]